MISVREFVIEDNENLDEGTKNIRLNYIMNHLTDEEMAIVDDEISKHEDFRHIGYYEQSPMKIVSWVLANKKYVLDLIMNKIIKKEG